MFKAYFIYISLIVLFPCDGVTKNIEYINNQYNFSFLYDAKGIKSVHTDTPPSPLHGIVIKYKNGDTITVHAEYMTIFFDDGFPEVVRRFDDIVSKCSVISFYSLFMEYYKCDDEYIAYKYINDDEYKVIYTIQYKNNNRSQNIKYFEHILKTFKIHAMKF